MPTAVENWSDKAAQAFDNQDFAMTIRYCIKALSLDPSFPAALKLKTIAERCSAIAILRLPVFPCSSAQLVHPSF
jgi:hypothetical protein